MEPRAYQSGAAGTPPPYPANPAIGFAQSALNGVPATEPGAHYFYMVGEDVRNLIIGGGQAPHVYRLTQIVDAVLAIKARIQT